MSDDGRRWISQVAIGCKGGRVVVRFWPDRAEVVREIDEEGAGPSKTTRLSMFYGKDLADRALWDAGFMLNSEVQDSK